jgi:hypothetical protein
MRILIALAIGLVLGLFGGFILATNAARTQAAGLPGGINTSPCAGRIEKTIAFTAPDAQDVLTVQSSGPRCDNLIANVTIRTRDGHVVFAHAQRIDTLMDPRLNPIAANGVRAVLEDYAVMTDGGARAMLPDWPDGGEIAAGSAYAMLTPTATAMLYRRVREQNAPLLRLREGRDSGAYFAYLPEIDEVEQIARYAL